MRRISSIVTLLVVAGCGDSRTPMPQRMSTLPAAVNAHWLVEGAPIVSVTVAPRTVAVVAGATQHFSARVTGIDDTAVTWSVKERRGCGAVSSSGDYVAPSAAATCHVVATSVVDRSKAGFGTAIVATLTAGAMTHISTGKPAYASEGTASLLTDGGYRSPNAWSFDPSHCSPSAPCWAAVNVGRGPSAVLVDWSYQDGKGEFDTKAWGGNTITNYLLFVSADSTNGADGSWKVATELATNKGATVGANTLIQRSHLISFAGYSWVKLAITTATADEIDELDVWDASGSHDDTFFFHGDSITHRCANLRGTDATWAEQPSFQADVQAAHPAHFPLQVGGGITSQGAADAVSEVSTYLTLFRPVKYWFLTMGTNDLCGGAATYAANAQKWIDAVKGAGVIPILVHPIWGNDNASYCSDNGPSFNAAVDALVAANGLMPAVPLYEATVGHPEYFDGGDVHPNAAGCAAWNKTFADAVSSFYH